MIPLIHADFHLSTQSLPTIDAFYQHSTEVTGVVDHPFAVRMGWRCGDLFYRGCDQLRFPHQRSPVVERTIHQRGWPKGEHLLPRGLARELLVAQSPADHLTDGVELLDLRQRLGSGHDILRPTMPVTGQHAPRYGRDVPLVNQRPGLWFTAFEAIAGLIIEGVFIAMLIQRFFGSQ